VRLRKYTFVGRTRRGHNLRGERHAENREQLLRMLALEEITPVHLEEVAAAPVRPHPLLQVDDQSLAVIFRQLHIMYTAGMSLDSAFYLVAEQGGSATQRILGNGVAEALRRGMSLSETMALFPRIFTEGQVAMVRLGEVGGLMPVVLEAMAALAEQRDTMTRRIRAALTYPLFVAVAAMATVSGLFAFVMPPFLELVKELHVQLPMLTRFMIVVAAILRAPSFWVAVAAAAAGLVAGWRAVRHEPHVRLLVDRLKLQNPVLGGVMHKIALSRSLQMLAALGRAGVPMEKALELAGDTSGNVIVRAAFRQASRELQTGSSLTTALLGRGKIFPPELVAYVEAGEVSGALPEMLVKAAEIFTLETAYALDVLPDLLEPLIITVLGALCGLVLISILVPLYGTLKQM
jgi:type IV pilus assembly protein PilC